MALLNFGFNNIDLWRSEEMQLVQVGQLAVAPNQWTLSATWERAAVHCGHHGHQHKVHDQAAQPRLSGAGGWGAMRGRAAHTLRENPAVVLQLMIPAEAAHDTIEALGDVGLLQFKDLNTHKSAFQRTYATQVRPPYQAPATVPGTHACMPSKSPCSWLPHAQCRCDDATRWPGAFDTSRSRCAVVENP